MPVRKRRSPLTSPRRPAFPQDAFNQFLDIRNPSWRSYYMQLSINGSKQGLQDQIKLVVQPFAKILPLDPNPPTILSDLAQAARESIYEGNLEAAISFIVMMKIYDALEMFCAASEAQILLTSEEVFSILTSAQAAIFRSLVIPPPEGGIL